MAQQLFLREGWLQKRGATNKAYKKRFFRLDKESLKYFKDESSSIERGHINDISEICDFNQDETKFILKPNHSTGRTYYLKAESADDKARWVKAISEV